MRVKFPFGQPTPPWNKEFHQNPALQNTCEVFGFTIMEPLLRQKENDIEKWLPGSLYCSYICITKKCGTILPYSLK